MDAKSVRNMASITAVTNKHTAKLHHVGSLYILTYDVRNLKHKNEFETIFSEVFAIQVAQVKFIIRLFNSFPNM